MVGVDVLKFVINQGRFRARRTRYRCVNDYIQRCGAAEISVNDLHTTIDLCGLVVVVDESIFYRKSCRAYDADDGKYGKHGDQFRISSLLRSDGSDSYTRMLNRNWSPSADK